MVRCNKCGSDKTFTVTAQIRRADEGMTEYFFHFIFANFFFRFHDCLNCGKSWKS